MSCSCPGTNNPLIPSVQGVCGTFDTDIDNPDQGCCIPYREKRGCASPTLPVIVCDDDQYEVIPNPDDPDHPFKISARIFDEDCDTITDEDGEDILTLVA